MTQLNPVATEIAQRLWEGERVNNRSPQAVVAVVGRVCAQLRTGIGRWIGAEGYRTLLERGLAETRTEHPALAELSCRGEANDRLAEAVRAHGAIPVVDAFVALVARMVELLGRVVGAEMAARLVEQSWAATPSLSPNTKLEGVG